MSSTHQDNGRDAVPHASVGRGEDSARDGLPETNPRVVPNTGGGDPLARSSGQMPRGVGLDGELVSRPDWWHEVGQDGVPPDRELGYLDLVRMQSAFRKRARETVWSIQGRGGSHNWLRLGLAGLAGLTWLFAVDSHGLQDWAALGAGFVFALAIANLMAMMLIWLKVVALADWLRRLGAGDLEYRMQFRHESTLRHLCAALDALRERSRRVIDLRIVDRLADELNKRNAALETALEDLARTQEQIVARQKSAELGGLVAGIAEEIRSPFGSSYHLVERTRDVLREAVETAEREQGRLATEAYLDLAELAGQIMESLDHIERNARRADEIVRAMLVLGRETGVRVPVDFNRIVAEQARRGISARIGTVQIELDELYDEAVGTVNAETAGIARLVRNLVSNARHAVMERAAREGGGYRGTVRIATRAEHGQVVIEVEDNGIGMSEEVLSRATAPFFTTRSPNEGAGLGLGQSENVARSHGGSLAIESRPGSGTRAVARIARGEAA